MMWRAFINNCVVIPIIEPIADGRLVLIRHNSLMNSSVHQTQNYKEKSKAIGCSSNLEKLIDPPKTWQSPSGLKAYRVAPTRVATGLCIAEVFFVFFRFPRSYFCARDEEDSLEQKGTTLTGLDPQPSQTCVQRESRIIRKWAHFLDDPKRINWQPRTAVVDESRQHIPPTLRWSHIQNSRSSCFILLRRLFFKLIAKHLVQAI